MAISRTAPIQGRCRTAPNPSPISWWTRRRGRAVHGGSATRSSVTRLTANVAASTRNAPRGPMATTMSPARPGPTMLAKWKVLPDRALPAPSSSAGRTLGSSAPKAGRKNASPAPTRKTSGASTSTPVWPLTTRASPRAASSRLRSAPIRTRTRGRRSAQTPPSRANSTRLANRAASTRPRSPRLPPESRTCTVTATGNNWSPMALTAWPMNSRRKSRWRSALLTRSVSGMRAPGVRARGPRGAGSPAA